VLTVGRLVVFPGFEILAFPSNQFGGQEPGSNEQIKETACSRFKAEFPIFAKV
jgi:glutathione peroxidase